MTDSRIVAPEASAGELQFEHSLRPRTLAEFVGQEHITANLQVYVRAALQRGEPLDHVLLFGPPGLGKTTLAHVLANELGAGLRVTSGPALEKPGDIAAILTNLGEGDILFIDEIHRLSTAVEEVLYPAVEDFALDLVVGQGPTARSVRIDVPRFTLVGATTRASLLTAALRSRFGIVERLDFYSDQELVQIITRSAQLLGIPIDPQGAGELSRRSRGTPRIANRLLRRVRDFAEVEADGRISSELAIATLERLKVDELGLDELDRKILLTIIEGYAGGPVGLSTLAASLAEDRGAVEEMYEPFLMQRGLLQRTPRGRVATPRAYQHLRLKPPRSGPTLFG